MNAQIDDLKGNPPTKELVNMQESFKKLKNEDFKDKKIKGKDYPAN